LVRAAQLEEVDIHRRGTTGQRLLISEFTYQAETLRYLAVLQDTAQD